VSIVVVGVNHRSTPVETLEKVMIPAERLERSLDVLSGLDDIREVVVLSTCNRTEVYAVVERFHVAHDEIRRHLACSSGVPAAELEPHVYFRHDEAVISHLFGVAAGLDSAVLGETEIVGQVRDAWDSAMRHGTARSTLNLLFRHALETGKRARTETAISRSTASMSHAAVEMAREILGSLEGRTVLVIGAGEMGEGVATALARAGASNVTVANRTESRGAALAERVGARLAGLDALVDEIAVADVVVACTGSGEVVVTREMVERTRQGSTAPLLIVDIALPRDVEHAVGGIEGVRLRDIDDLNSWAARGIEKRSAEVGQVRAIVADEVSAFLEDQAQRQAAPLVAQLREHFESVRAAEVARLSSRLNGLDDDQRDAVDAVTRAIVAKLLHSPSVRLREAAGSAPGERLSAAVRDLFDLD